MMRPPVEITEEALRSVARVERLLGRYEGLHSPRPLPRLRRSNRVRQQGYYEVLGACDRAGNSTAFVEFGAAIVEEAPQRFLENLRAEPTTPSHRINIAVRHFESQEFSRKDYASLFPNISTATASRDLRHGVESGRLIKSGDKAPTSYRVAE